ncbi:MAG: hypothetical protein JRC68_10030 [Deltaproteobacteria bacterium]|nr:hypothetical protein [Deltaproteobacteria bacterium]
MRETGIIDSKVEVNGVTVIQSSNSLSENEVIVIDEVDVAVSNVSDSEFSVKKIGIVGAIWKSRSPYYDHGHPVEMVNKLLMKDKLHPPYAWKKYPLIYLKQGFKEVIKNDGYYCTLPNLNIVILAFTDKNYTSDQRDENVLIPILYPLYASLKNEIENSDDLGTEFLEHSKYDKLFWGTEQAMGNKKNILNDPIDAIELEIYDLLVLKTNKKVNCKT